ncbi:MAG: hypothetical protein R2745_15400 [Vicinamibacterales bacterium]
MRSRAVLVSCAAAALLAAGCGNDTPTSATTTTTSPITTPVTVSFPGSVGPGGSVSRSFVPQITGPAKAVVSDISPPTALSVALGIPRADGSGCLPAISSTSGNLQSVEVSSAVGLGSFCVMVYAPASSADAVGFTVTLTYP